VEITKGISTQVKKRKQMSRQTVMQMVISHFENESIKGSNHAYIIARYLRNYLEMEKQQIIDACNQIEVIGLDNELPGVKYYNKTFKD